MPSPVHASMKRLGTPIDKAVSEGVPEKDRCKSVSETLPVQQLQTDLENCQSELEETQKKLAIQINHANAFQEKVKVLERDLKKQHAELHQEIHILSQELAGAQVQGSMSMEYGLGEAMRNFYNSDEQTALLQERHQLFMEIEHQREEAQKWRAEAYSLGSKTVSRCSQASIDEAVRMEREKDSWLVRNLSDQIANLEAEKSVEMAKRREFERLLEVAKLGLTGEVGKRKKSLLVMSLKAEVAILRAGHMLAADMAVSTPW